MPSGAPCCASPRAARARRRRRCSRTRTRSRATRRSRRCGAVRCGGPRGRPRATARRPLEGVREPAVGRAAGRARSQPAPARFYLLPRIPTPPPEPVGTWFWILAPAIDARLPQSAGLVPIVEPEVTLGPGNYGIEETAYWSERVNSHVFRLLNEYDVILEGILLKPNMILPGEQGGRWRRRGWQGISRLSVCSRPSVSACRAALSQEPGPEEACCGASCGKTYPWELRPVRPPKPRQHGSCQATQAAPAWELARIHRPRGLPNRGMSAPGRLHLHLPTPPAPRRRRPRRSLGISR